MSRRNRFNLPTIGRRPVPQNGETPVDAPQAERDGNVRTFRAIEPTQYRSAPSTFDSAYIQFSGVDLTREQFAERETAMDVLRRIDEHQLRLMDTRFTSFAATLERLAEAGRMAGSSFNALDQALRGRSASNPFGDNDPPAIKTKKPKNHPEAGKAVPSKSRKISRSVLGLAVEDMRRKDGSLATKAVDRHPEILQSKSKHLSQRFKKPTGEK